MVLIQKKGLAILCVLLSIAFTMRAQDDVRIKDYINQYKLLAVQEQQRSGIPAAITLAQGIHETMAGTSELATMANNHFGIKCKKDWTGETFAHTDDAPNECFRKYAKAEDSYKDHSDYLYNSVRYASLFKLSITDYMAWAFGLKQCGYATNPRYAQTLIKYIEDYHLQDYTYAAMGKSVPGATVARKAEIIPEHDAEPVKPPVQQTQVAVKEVPKDTPKIAEVKPPVENIAKAVAPPPVVTKPVTSPAANSPLPPNVKAYGAVLKVNGLKAVYVKKGETPLEYAYKNCIRYSRLLEINEINEGPFPADMYLYLERKNFKGVKPMHMVKPDETLAMISQAEGIQIKYLRSLNLIAANEEPVPGAVLELQKQAKKKPMVTVVKKEAPIKAPVTNVAVQTKPATVKPVPQVAKPNTVASQPVKAPVQATPKPDTVAVSKPVVVATENKPQPTTPAVDTKAEEDVIKSTVAIKEEIKKPEPVVPEQPKKEELVPAKEIAESPVVDASKPVNVGPNTGIPEKEAVKPPVPEVQSAPVSVGPNVGIPEKKAEPAKPVVVAEKKEEKPKVAEEVKPEEPKDELALLKEKFDRVVYANDNAKAIPPVTEPVKTEPVKAEPVVTAPLKTEVKKEETQAEVQAKPVVDNNIQTLPPSTDPAKYYTVKKGDTAFTIAKAYNITMRQLMNWNGLDFDAIKIGQKLRVKP